MIVQLFKSTYCSTLKSTSKNKRFMVILGDGSVVHFGDDRYQIFTMHKDQNRKRLYNIRHTKNENWIDITTPAFWSRWTLWNSPSLAASIRDTEKRFGIKIIDETKSQE